MGFLYRLLIQRAREAQYMKKRGVVKRYSDLLEVVRYSVLWDIQFLLVSRKSVKITFMYTRVPHMYANG